MNNNTRRQKIWLTGSHGFIGTHLVSELSNTYDLTCLSHTRHENTSTDNKNIRTTYVNFQNHEEINNVIESLGLPDILIHAGWGDMTNPHSMMHLTDNVSQSKNIIQALYNAGLDKIVFLGSMNEYGNRFGSLYEDMGSTGEITNYAKGKIEVAKFGFEKAKEKNKKFIHIRLFYTYGPIQKEKTLIQDLYHGYKNNVNVSLSSCEQYRDYIHISDVVKGIKLLCKLDESTIVNLGSGKAIKLKEFVSLFWKILGGKPENLHFGEKPQRKEQPQQNCFANLDKLERLTGWKPTVSLEEGIKLTIREFDKLYFKCV